MNTQIAPSGNHGEDVVVSGPWTLMTVRAQGGFAATHLTPGVYRVGSAPDCEVLVELNELGIAGRVRVEDGAPPVFEVDGSEVELDGRALDKDSKHVLRSGSSLHVGQTLLMVHARRPAAPRRLWHHGSFEMRVEEECVRGEHRGETFTVLRARVTGPSAKAEELLSNHLRLTDVLGVFAPGDYEALLPDTGPEGARKVVSRISAAFADTELKITWGVATFPADGMSPDELTAKAARAVRATAPAPVSLRVDPREQETLGRLANSQLSVLVSGETGSGKERTAELVHQLSRRATRPFIKLCCANISEALLESELFGHERGSLSGTATSKQGAFQAADTGTIFLDEIAELTPGLQAKLLRVIEERQVTRVGGVKPVGVDVRIIASTSRNLEDEVTRGTFRNDLYYRLAGTQVRVPPLRERLDELRGLAESIIGESSEGRQVGLSDEAFDLMCRYAWPGNVRELRNVLERAVQLATSGVIKAEHLPLEKLSASFATRKVTTPSGHRTGTHKSLSSSTGSGPRPGRREATGEMPSLDTTPTHLPQRTAADSGELRRSIRELERERIREALERAVGNQTRAAEILGISRRTLVSRLGELGFPRPRKRRS